MAKPVTPEEGKASLLAAILEHTIWPGEAQTDQLILGLYGRDRQLLKVLKIEMPKLKIRGKSVVVREFNSLPQTNPPHVLLLPGSENSNLADILQRLRQSHTLIITDGSKDQDNVMINFTHPAKNILTFEVNRSNVIDAGLQLSKEILLFGGTEVDKALIYRETEAELAHAKAIARQQQEELDTQEKLLAAQEDKIQQQSKQVKAKEMELAAVENKLAEMDMKLLETENRLIENEDALAKKERVLAKKEAAIAEVFEKIAENLALIAQQKTELEKQEHLIAAKNDILAKQVSTIEYQQYILVAAAAALMVVLTLIAMIFRSYRIKNRLNLQLKNNSVALEKANQKLVMMTDAKSRFLSTMSHEIRTPLNGVIGVAELLQSTELTKQQLEYIAIILKSADNLLSLINDILDISKIEAGKLELEEIPFNLREILGDTLQTLALRANDKKLELAFHIPPEVPDNLLGDPVRLRQVVVNLVGNAIKFTEKGEIVVDMKPEAIDDEKVRLAFEVRDTGIGISEEQRQKIFEAFGQADSTTTRQYGGTGLGLTIASELVGKMGGQLEVSSEPGKGSTFSFTITFRLSRQGAKTPQPSVDLRGKRVLVVDDNSTNRMILEEIMSSWGMVVTTVDSAAKALALLAEKRTQDSEFSMAILDVMMPGMDGFELAEKIRSQPDNAKIRILILSSAGFSGDENYLRQLDISRTLLKPVKHSELLVAITDALGVATAEDPTSPQASKPENLQPRKVLLVEDGVINQKVATDLLVKRGHQVELAENGEDAIAAIKSGTFDVVLMDVQMPVMDGLTATRKIRELERETNGHIPIVAMTAGATTEDRERCMAAGMDNYVAKPFRAAELFRAVETVPPISAVTSTKPATLPEKPTAAAPAKEEAMADRESFENNHPDNANARQPPPASVSDDRLADLDWQGALKQLEGDKQLLRELTEMFLQQYPDLMAAIDQALAKQDAQELRRAAHTLKSSAHVIGAKKTAAAALVLENLSRDNQLAAAGKAIAPLQAKIAELKPLLEAAMVN